MFSVLLPDNPVPFTPSKLICVGRNYAGHAREMKTDLPKEPVLFLKPPSAIIRSGSTVVKPSPQNDLHHEVELTLLIGRRGSGISEDAALSYVSGYGVGLDMTLRDVQSAAKEQGLPWSVAKGFDTSAPLSDFVPAGLVAEPDRLKIELLVNGELRQQGSTEDLIFPLRRLIAFTSRYFTLERGDILFTGTPEGVASVGSADVLEGALRQADGTLLTSLTVYVQ